MSKCKSRKVAAATLVKRGFDAQQKKKWRALFRQIAVSGEMPMADAAILSGLCELSEETRPELEIQDVSPLARYTKRTFFTLTISFSAKS